ncbi:hypothetical protein MTR_7g116160 [Medicago truncatula]|uniref:AIPP2-like SPOC-like domain-containing protein n=1 Tax=Medicago truncatula TaxID=3880 RepID=G7L1Y0_MEDTR|nr:hypothetical protein MTR_7g116160 [Medicago truncatula]
MTEEAIHQFLQMLEFHHSWKLLMHIHDDSYRGKFHISNRHGIERTYDGHVIERTYDGFQAHLSTCHAVEVINFVSSFPEIITLDELPRSSIWPSQFRAQVTKEDIGLYFFAKDVNSYDTHYSSLMNKMIKNDMALKGNLNGAELLIFPSNILPQEIQRCIPRSKGEESGFFCKENAGDERERIMVAVAAETF